MSGWKEVSGIAYNAKKAKVGHRVVTTQILQVYCGPKLWSTTILGILDTTWGLTKRGSLRRADRRYKKSLQTKSLKDTLAVVIPICGAVIAASATIIAAVIKLA